MRLAHLFTSVAAAALLSGCNMSDTTTEPADTAREAPATLTQIAPPSAARREKVIEQVGRTRNDPYNWLKDDNWQTVLTDPSVLRQDIRAYLEAENAYTDTMIDTPTQALQEELFQEMRGRIKEDDSSVPARDGDYEYYSRTREGGEYAVYARRAIGSEAEEILFDGDAEGAGKAYFSLAALSHSPNHELVAYAIDTKGSEFYEIGVRNIKTGETLNTIIPGTTGDFEWNAGSDAIYWVERDDNGRPVAVHMRRLGETTDTELYRETDPGYFVGINKSQSGDIIFITSGSHTTSEAHWFAANEETPSPKLIAARETDVEYSVEHWNDAFIIQTNEGGAVDFKLMTAPMTATSRSDWTNLVDHRPGTLLLGTVPYRDHLIRMERADGLPRIVVRERASGSEHEIAFDEAAYDLGLSSGYEYETTRMRFDYASPTTPDQVFDYDMASRDRVLLKTREVPSGHNAADYVVERLLAPGHDGAEVPVTVLRHRDTPVDGTAPLLLYGYGSYGATISADFRTSRLSLVDRGFVYAIAHPRGSMAKGYQWYLDGKLEKKPNTFKDYVSAGEHLITEGYSREGLVVGMGGSAGGLLMGAAANMAPEMFAGIIAAVPFVDVINTMSDDTLPLTPPEWPEWGNPLISSEDYDTIMAYSPYDQVTDKPYPAMLITGGLSDPRVTYWEPAKWAAKLRHEAPDAGPYYLKINMEAGHGGASGRFEGLKETALEYAFALHAVGLHE